MNWKSGRCVAIVVGSLMVGSVLAGCTTPSPGSATKPLAQASPPSLQPQGTVGMDGASGKIDHVVIIVEENKPSSNIIGNEAAPYINKLAQEYALASNYRAVTHPSLPNYLAMTSGTTAGISNDCNPPGGSCVAKVASIADEIGKSGRNWKMYAEDMPAPCTATNSGSYAVKHNPFMYYPGVTDDGASCAAHVVPFTQLSSDLGGTSTLPDYAFISPNLCNDMHNCSIQTGDAWLSQQVPAILASPAFTKQNSLLVITWDEGNSGSNTVATIFAGPAAKKGFTSTVKYSHYSLLHTIESAWGLAPLTSNDGGAPVMSDLLK